MGEFGKLWEHTGELSGVLYGAYHEFSGNSWRLSGTPVWGPPSRYTVLRTECRVKFPQNQRCPAKITLHPPRSRCRTLLRTPLSHFPLIRSGQGAKGECRGKLVEGIAALLGSEKRIALQGGVAATVTPVALLCATKPGGKPGATPSCLGKPGIGVVLSDLGSREAFAQIGSLLICKGFDNLQSHASQTFHLFLTSI